MAIPKMKTKLNPTVLFLSVVNRGEAGGRATAQIADTKPKKEREHEDGNGSRCQRP